MEVWMVGAAHRDLLLEQARCDFQGKARVAAADVGDQARVGVTGFGHGAYSSARTREPETSHATAYPPLPAGAAALLAAGCAGASVVRAARGACRHAGGPRRAIRNPRGLRKRARRRQERA